MFEKLERLKNQYEELAARMERPEVYSDAAAFAACEREARELRPLVEAYRAWIAAGEDMDAATELGDEEEFRAAPSDALVVAHDGAEAAASRRRHEVASVGDDDGRRGETSH